MNCDGNKTARENEAPAEHLVFNCIESSAGASPSRCTGSNAETDKIVSRQAQLACLEVANEVVAKARQTNTSIIVFDGDRIQRLTADEYENLAGRNTTAPKNGEDHS